MVYRGEERTCAEWIASVFVAICCCGAGRTRGCLEADEENISHCLSPRRRKYVELDVSNHVDRASFGAGEAEQKVSSVAFPGTGSPLRRTCTESNVSFSTARDRSASPIDFLGPGSPVVALLAADERFGI